MPENKGTILIVDDEPAICSAISNYLGFQGFECSTAGEADTALKILGSTPVDCILSDVTMPGKSGLELLREVRTGWPETAFILFTAKAEIQIAVDSMKDGAYDFLTKPVQLPQLARCVTNALEKKRLKSELRTYQQQLESLVHERTSQIQDAMRALEDSHTDTINRLCHAAEYRDDETGFHVLRISKYCEILAREMKMSDEEVFLLGKASPLHDIGKIGIPDNILLKQGKLTAEEFQLMKRHAEIGGEILKNAKSKVLKVAEIVACTHHEKWDGSGYPKGLKGRNIPLMGRVTALADVFDALTMKRCYKPAFTLETSANIINQGSGTHFDPEVVNAFGRRFRDFISVHKEYAEVDGAPGRPPITLNSI